MDWSPRVDVVSSIANQLKDPLSGESLQGGHATVYFGEKYVYKLTEQKVMEKSSKINAILASSNEALVTQLVPQTILYKDFGERCLVVEERMIGIHPHRISNELLVDIVNYLKLIHEIPIEQVLTNFEGDEQPAHKYWSTQLHQAQQFELKLRNSGTLEQTDSALINKCLDVIKEISFKENRTPQLVVIYKDIHSKNILVDQNGHLSAIIDWDSAMSGPRELEYVVLWHRYPEIQQLIPPNLDKDTFIIAGLVQSLRFWKSFTQDSKYINQQRNALKRTLELHQTNHSNWMTDL